jgi:hypothetical protein
VEQLQGDVSRLESEKNRLTAENDSLRGRVRELEALTVSQASTLARQQAEIDQMKRQNEFEQSKQQREINQMKDQIEDLSDLQGQIETIMSRLKG